mmetsp:Transcript_7096/g.15655  ORF Transcript_7096/g.15655 Transcript_7096/m.15655 type:complete len:96 (-) Transcript_7096:57-344(-)
MFGFQGGYETNEANATYAMVASKLKVERKQNRNKSKKIAREGGRRLNEKIEPHHPSIIYKMEQIMSCGGIRRYSWASERLLGANISHNYPHFKKR